MEYQAYDKFEYKVIGLQHNYFPEFERKLNVLGQDGWELIMVFNGTDFIFKRKLSCYNTDLINE